MITPLTTIALLRADSPEISFVADCACRLREMEGGDFGGVVFTPEIATLMLRDVIAWKTGVVLVSSVQGETTGCIAVEFLPREKGGLIGGLVVTPGAPLKTAICLFSAAAEICLSRGLPRVFLLAGTEKNRRRPTYRAIGFRDTGIRSGNSVLMATDTRGACEGLRRRLKDSS